MFELSFAKQWVLGLTLCVVAVPLVAFEDPTRPAGAVAAKSKRQTLKLESVLLSGERKIAVINGRAYQQGDSVHGALLRTVNQRSVILERGNKQETLTLFKKIVNK